MSVKESKAILDNCNTLYEYYSKVNELEDLGLIEVR